MEAAILLVEDDGALREGLCELLAREGYRTKSAATAREADALIQAGSFDLCLMDVGLPDGDGVSLCRRWRAEGRNFPIIFLTALDEEIHVVRALDAGGSDYVAKPFRTMELLSRVRAQLRAHKGAQAASGALSVDFERLTTSLGGESLFLTPTEYKLLGALMRSGGRVLTRAVLLEALWDEGGRFVDDNTLSVHISRLREKIGAARIDTVRGAGYRWVELP